MWWFAHSCNISTCFLWLTLLHIKLSLHSVLTLSLRHRPVNDGDTYDIGVGIADVTGPAAEVSLMGYAKFDQQSNGIHTRQWSRAFIIGDGIKKIVFVSVDAGMISQAVTTEVLHQLRRRFGNIYTKDNVCLSGTHTHSGPGGFFQYFLYDVPSFGFIKESFHPLVNGIVQSIIMADGNIKSGKMFYNMGELTDASVNRSPPSYLNNPQEERDKYQYDTDKTMLLLKLEDLNGNPIGMINWFAVHGTSMNNTNKLISSDNKGYASLLFEQDMNPPGTLVGKGPFVAAFAQTNEGDVSPNTKGARCVDTGEPCDNLTSTCHGLNSLCIAFGPGKDMIESTEIIGQKQYAKAKELFASASNPIYGSVQYIHQHIEISKQQLVVNGKNVTTCKPSLGFSFAAGTTDGPGLPPFHQGTTDVTAIPNDLGHSINNLLAKVSPELLRCHHPKAVLLPTGDLSLPYQWTPDIVPTQILRIGNLVILAVPGEFTTMSGRRLRKAVYKVLNESGFDPKGDLIVAISGLSNLYTNYITTYEEYQVQRYEGGSTMYGPYTLDAYINQFVYLAQNLAKSSSVDPGPNPPNLMNQQIELLPEILFETAPMGKVFGSVLNNVYSDYTPGSLVTATFVCGNPRNNVMAGGTFLIVQYRNPGTGQWETVVTDANWETKFHWRQSDVLLKQSQCTVEWQIPSDAKIGDYRIGHLGFFKELFSGIKPYQGFTNIFKINSVNSIRKRFGSISVPTVWTDPFGWFF